MLAITGRVTLWYVSSVTNMRYGKYRLFAEVELLGKNPYTGDAYLFLSKDRQTNYCNMVTFVSEMMTVVKDSRTSKRVRNNDDTEIINCTDLYSLESILKFYG